MELVDKATQKVVDLPELATTHLEVRRHQQASPLCISASGAPEHLVATDDVQRFAGPEGGAAL